MQVKKFEARTMKEALEMVKAQLGPDAIILNARDNSKNYGLVGEGSVEITAAVTEETLQKKKFVESRMRDQDREKLLKSSARIQKKVIEEMVNKHIEQSKGPKPITQRRYIDIADEGASGGSSAVAAVPVSALVQTPSGPMPESKEIKSLRGEIEHLKQVIARFQSVPQSVQEPTPAVGAARVAPELRGLYTKLADAGLAEEYIIDLIQQAIQSMPADKVKNKALVEAWVAKTIMTSTKLVSEKEHARVQIFVGPAGAGKTSSLIKLASHYVVNHNKKVAIATTDTFKVGATEQLRIYAQILNVPFVIVRNGQDWPRILSHLSDYDYILIDAPGMSLKNVEEISRLRSLLPKNEIDLQVHLVLTALAKDSDLTEIGKRYQLAQFTDVIFSGLDESVQHGNIYNFMKRFNTPLHSFGLGSRVPEDFEIASRERVLDLLFRLTKIKKDSFHNDDTGVAP